MKLLIGAMCFAFFVPALFAQFEGIARQHESVFDIRVCQSPASVRFTAIVMDESHVMIPAVVAWPSSDSLVVRLPNQDVWLSDRPLPVVKHNRHRYVELGSRLFEIPAGMNVHRIAYRVMRNNVRLHRDRR